VQQELQRLERLQQQELLVQQQELLERLQQQELLQREQLQEQQLLLSYRKQPGQQQQ
jgi:hypothetical protein